MCSWPAFGIRRISQSSGLHPDITGTQPQFLFFPFFCALFRYFARASRVVTCGPHDRIIQPIEWKRSIWVERKDGGRNFPACHCFFLIIFFANAESGGRPFPGTSEVNLLVRPYRFRANCSFDGDFVPNILFVFNIVIWSFTILLFTILFSAHSGTIRHYSSL